MQGVTKVRAQMEVSFGMLSPSLSPQVQWVPKMNDASVAFIFVIVGVAVYYVPWIVAVRNHKRLALMIGFLNIFFAWTIIGWLFLLVWASIKDPDDVRRDRDAVLKEAEELADFRRHRAANSPAAVQIATSAGEQPVLPTIALDPSMETTTKINRR